MKKQAQIWTFTPNPALDLGGIVDQIVPNEKNYVHDSILHPGGNGINAARIAHRLGARVTATGFLGGGTGQEIRSFLDQEGLPHRFVDVEGMTRINVTVTTRSTPLQTRLSFPGPTISKEQAREIRSYVFQSARNSTPRLLVIGGSLPPGYTPKQVRTLIQECRKRGYLCLVDMPGSILKELVDANPFFIKPNIAEFQQLVGKKLTQKNDVLKAALKLTKHIPLICISSVEDGAMLVTQENAWFGKIPPIQIRSTVGAGDSMVGAISYRLAQHVESATPLRDDDVRDLLQWGLGAACATLARTGTALGLARDIRTYRKQTRVEKLL